MIERPIIMHLVESIACTAVGVLACIALAALMVRIIITTLKGDK